MSQRFLSGLSAALVLSTLGVMPSSYGSASVANDEGVEENVSADSELVNHLGESVIAGSVHDSEPVLAGVGGSAVGSSDSLDDHRVGNSAVEFSEQRDPIKVGEYQDLSGVVDDPTAVIHSHVIDGREAVTVYVDGIPVLTLLGEEAIAQSAPQVTAPDEESTVAPDADAAIISDGSPVDALTETEGDVSADEKTVKLPTTRPPALPEAVDDEAERADAEKSESSLASRPDADSLTDAPADDAVNANTPVQQATAIAARINQVSRDGIDSSDIIAAWDDEAEMYVIKVGDTVLIEFDADVMLPDTTGSTAEDVLQATNRIRRQLGADPLTSIEGAPTSSGSLVAVGPVEFSFRGVASWYGPGFHGRRSASGEIFDQNAMTAAHRHLPFGTLVRVTNLNNGASVTVRITDRGPFSGGRVIDLSAGAARAIGMIQTGVATVQAEVLATP